MTYQSTTSIASLYGIHFFDPVNPLLFFLDPPRSYSWLPCNLDRYQDPRHTMFCTPHGETSWFSLLDAHHRCSKTLRCSAHFCQPAGIPMRNRMIIHTVQTSSHLCCRRLLKSRSLASTCNLTPWTNTGRWHTSQSIPGQYFPLRIHGTWPELTSTGKCSIPSITTNLK